MASSSSQKNKATILSEQEDPSIPNLIHKRRRSPTIAEIHRRDSTAEPDIARTDPAQIVTPSLHDESDSSSYRDDIPISDLNDEKEMDVGEIRDILGRLHIPTRVDFEKASGVATKPESRKFDGSSWMDKKRLAAFRSACPIPNDVEIRLPLADERPWDMPKGYFCVYECFFSWLGLRFLIPQFLFNY